MAFLDPVLNPLLQPLLNMSPFWGVVVLAFVITLLITLAYKFFTDQNEMKRLKGQQKDFQKRMRELRSNPEEMMKVQKEAMKVNTEYMKHSLKVTLITFLPIILIFGWMNAHLAYEPIYPGETYTVSALFAEGVTEDVELILAEGTTFAGSDATQKINTATVNKLPKGLFGGTDQVPGNTWRLQSEAGSHFVTVKVGEQQKQQKVLITKELRYEEPFTLFDHSDIVQMQVNYKDLKPLGTTSLLGWKPGWLGIYIILSIVFSIGLRKVLKIY